MPDASDAADAIGHPARHAVLRGKVNAMRKGLSAKKELRRKPLKTAQERRLAKRAKKHTPRAPLGPPSRS
ncbi:hypothetical protein IPC744_11780 [Pseudomonas aeruginosa]|nr:hypothetical protein IPC776_10135 [Pseudomonas aeruginosa]RPW68046.1 hypothetical protein IPC744_11780 [Pseudomonas aeruginosa]RQH95975.1 hypothetical protein IPC97_10280 [Pseudomonas aeruginosa]